MIRKQHGYTLLEITLVTSLIIGLLLIINPTPLFKLFNITNSKTQLIEESISITYHIESLINNRLALLGTSPNELSIQTTTTTATIKIDPNTTQSPYHLIKSTPTATIALSKRIHDLTSPTRPGIEFKYKDQYGNDTASIPDVTHIELHLALVENTITYNITTAIPFRVTNNAIEVTP